MAERILLEEGMDRIRDAKTTEELGVIMEELGRRALEATKEIVKSSWDESAAVFEHIANLYSQAGDCWDVLIKEEDAQRKEIGVIDLDDGPLFDEFQECFEVTISEYGGRRFLVDDEVRFGGHVLAVVGTVDTGEKQLLFTVKKLVEEDDPTLGLITKEEKIEFMKTGTLPERMRSPLTKKKDLG